MVLLRLISSTWPGSRRLYMAKALVPFYPLAGRLGINGDDGRMEINCNGEGALFVVSQADDLSVDDVKKFKPSPELRRLFVPRIEPSSIILAIQVTFLKCGGVALGTALHHAAIDASSAFHFFQTWSAFSKHDDHAAVELPCHVRTLLRARSPPTVHPNALLTLHPKLIFSDPKGPLAFEVFTISRDQVASLKHLCGGGTTSTFCAVSALIWQCTCIARRLPPDSEARMVFPADLRRRIRPPLPSHYFGNAVFRPAMRHRRGGGYWQGGAGIHRCPHQGHHRADGQRAGTVRDRLLRDGRGGQETGFERHPATDGPACYQLVRQATVRCGFWVGKAAVNVAGGVRPRRLCVLDVDER